MPILTTRSKFSHSARVFAGFLLTFLCASCSVVLVYSTKEVHVRESDNTSVDIAGSELKDNKLDQESSGELKGVPGT